MLAPFGPFIFRSPLNSSFFFHQSSPILRKTPSFSSSHSSSSSVVLEDLDKDFVIYKSNTFRRKALGRSLSSRMLLESSVSSECALLSKYERLSQSMRSPNDPSPRQRKCGVWRILAQVLLAKRAIELPRKATNGTSAGSPEVLTSSFMEGIVRKEASTAASKEAESKRKKKIKRSSWLPDPQRRWPVQGW